MNTKLDVETINLSDRAVRVLSEDGLFRAVAIKNTTSAKQAQENHKYPANLAIPHSKVMCFGSLLAAFHKGEERVIVDLYNYDKIGKLYAESMSIGEIRGFASGYSNNGILQDSGILKVTRILYGKTEPISGIVEVKSNELSQIFEEYLQMSEQIPSFVLLDAKADADGKISQSGGILVQAMPGASDSDIEQLKNAVRNAKPISEYLDTKMRPDQILKEVLPFNFEIVKSTRLDFFCRCSKDLFKSKLITLGEDEIKAMRSDKHNELVCQFCSKKYEIEDSDFDEILLAINSKKN